MHGAQTEWLNYHHLLCFWLTARKGGVTAAAQELGLAQSTVSAQIRMLEDALGESGTTFIGPPTLARPRRRRFPASLDGAPMLMPGRKSATRRALDQWLHEQGIRPTVVGEFDDSALMKTFAQTGHRITMAPTVIETEIQRQYGLEAIGRVEQLRERYYAISVERQLQHPAVVAISETAREGMFG